MKSSIIKRSILLGVMAICLALTLVFTSVYLRDDTKTNIVDTNVPFDINGDGKVSLADVALLSQRVAGWKVFIYGNDKTDTDLNGKVNLSDVSRIAKQVAGWDFTENLSQNFGAYTWPELSPSSVNAGISYKTLSDAPVENDSDLSQVLLTTANNPSLAFNVACNIDGNNVTALLPAGTHINAMKVDFTYNGDSITMNGKKVESGVTEFDFRKPVKLTLNKGKSHTDIILSVMVLDTGLPSIAITTNDMKAIDSKVNKKSCSVYAGGGEFDNYSFNTNEYIKTTGTVKGRGWTSWYYYPKKSYTLKLDKKESLLGLPAHKEWVLAANFADRTLMRNAVGMELANLIGMETVMDVRYVDLWVNGDYTGAYNLIEKIEVSENRVNVTDFDENLAPKDMGYIIETNGHNKPEGEFGTWTNGQDADRVSKWKTLDENGLYTYDPISGDIFFSSKHYSSIFNLNKPSDGKLMDIPKEKMLSYINYIYNYMDSMEAAIKSKNYKEASKYLDMESMAKWYIIEELSMNTDSRLHCSCYMYKDAGGKMKMGPVWDFDLGFGNGKYANDKHQTNTYLDGSTWFKDLLSMPEFKKKVIDIWRDSFTSISSQLVPFIRKSADMLSRSQKYNFEQWIITEPAEHCYKYTTEEIDTYSKQIDYLADFTAMRIAYMEIKIEDQWAKELNY